MAFKKRKKPTGPSSVFKTAYVKPKKKRKTIEQKTAAQLIDPTDGSYSRYIRIRDSTFNGSGWVGTCISCPRTETICWFDADKDKWRFTQGWDNGHYKTRGMYKLRYDDFNCNLQCRHCNLWRDKGDMQKAYESGLLDKIGKVELARVEKDSKSEDSHKRPKKPELLQIIQDSKTYVNYALEHPDKYVGDDHICA
jgi:hypothetical protein